MSEVQQEFKRREHDISTLFRSQFRDLGPYLIECFRYFLTQLRASIPISFNLAGMIAKGGVEEKR